MDPNEPNSSGGDIFTADVKQETLPDETVSLRIKERDGTFLSITMDRNKTIRDLKEKLEASLGEQRRCLARNMRLSVQGASLDQDSLKVSEINLPEDAVIHMVRVQDSTMTIHPTPENRQNDANTYNAKCRLNSCRILQRNFEACVDAAQTSKDPEQRERFNDPESPTPANPTARDFGYLVRDMANSLRTWSFQLHRLSDQLIRDEALPEPMSKEYQQARRLIQNNMDASRYMAPELQNFCQFVIPLGDEPPRGLAVLNRNNATRRPSGVNSNQQ